MKSSRGKGYNHAKSFDGTNEGFLSLAYRWIVILSGVVWFLAVIKVFLLENREAEQAVLQANVPAYRGSEAGQGGAVPAGPAIIMTPNAADIVPESKPKITYETFDGPDRSLHAPVVSETARHMKIPTANEWDFIRARPHAKIDMQLSVLNGISPTGSEVISHSNVIKGEVAPVPAAPVPAAVAVQASVDTAQENTRPASQLSWPPVLADGSIPPGDGSDTMPLTGIKVPRFWEANEGANIFETGSMVNGQETIFLMIASYRDFQCRETITSAYQRSDHPERLYIGAVDQTVDGDTGCLDIDIPCSQDASQPICKYRDQISIYHMDASMATGPVTARHVGDRMYRGQYFVMQMDAHCLFINHWDTLIIDQWKSTGNEMAVLSSYLTDIQGSIDANGDSRRDTRPIMCNSDFEGMMPQRYLRHGSQPEERALNRVMPMLEPFWAAGFSFSRGHFKLQVPYDGYQPMVFQGEEIAIGIRAFTFGYDFYAPRDSVVFHEYAERSKRRKKIPMFWENSVQHKGEGQKSLKRSTSIIGMAPDIDPASWDHTEEKRYGLGNVRPLEQFYKLFLIDTKQRKAVPLCPFVRSGNLHNEFMKYLRPDRLGIDYSKLVDFDTRAYMKLA